MSGGSGGSGSGGRSGVGGGGQMSYEGLTAPITATPSQLENAMRQTYSGKPVKVTYHNISEPVIKITGKRGRDEDMTIWTRSKSIFSGGKKYEYNPNGLIGAMKRFEAANGL